MLRHDVRIRQMKRLLLTMLLVLTVGDALASPYADCTWLSVRVGRHRWGVWRLVDLADDHENPAPGTFWGAGPFRNYWCLTLGPITVLRVEETPVMLGVSACLGLATLAGLLAFAAWRWKRRSEPHPGA